MIKIWVDDERPAPKSYTWHCKTVFDTIYRIGQCYLNQYWSGGPPEVLLDLDHDASDEFQQYGSDYINILKWLASWMNDPGEQDGLEGHDATGDPVTIKVHFHSMNPVGVKNMRAIVKNCKWLEEV